MEKDLSRAKPGVVLASRCMKMSLSLWVQAGEPLPRLQQQPLHQVPHPEGAGFGEQYLLTASETL